MDLNPYSVAIGRGDGLVARTGDVVMFVADATAAGPLLRAIDSAAAAPSPGQALAAALATIALGPDSGSIPPFGVLAPAADGLVLMLRGHVTADIEADGAIRTLAGDRALTWVDEIVREPVNKIVIGGGDVPAPTANPYNDLRAGAVPGGGFVMHRVAEAQPTLPPPPVANQIEPEIQTAPPPRVADQLEPEIPAAPSPQVAAQIEPETRLVLGQIGEHAKPAERQRTAAPSGRDVPAAPAPQLPASDRPVGAPARKAAPPTAMARPIIGVLAAEDDAVYPLDRPYVIGRYPLIDKSVRDAVASPIVLPDEPQVSRVHAYVTLEAGAVLVRDAGTPGGTYLAAPGDATWMRVGDQPTELKPGWCLRVGQRILVYQKAPSAQ